MPRKRCGSSGITPNGREAKRGIKDVMKRDNVDAAE